MKKALIIFSSVLGAALLCAGVWFFLTTARQNAAAEAAHDAVLQEYAQLEQSAADHAAAMEEMKSMHESYVTMTKYIIGLLFVAIFSLIGAIIYGAIGKQGLFAVRDSMPKVAQAIPWHNDLDRFTNRRSAA